MKTLPLAEAKAKLSALVDEVASRDERVTITKRGRPVVVVMSTDELTSLEATLEIMSDPDFYKEILENRAALRRGEGRTYYDLDELFKEEVPARAAATSRRASNRRGRPTPSRTGTTAQGARSPRRPKEGSGSR